jgi:anti-sigma regulatory factor (Ser/Thr protein kinase)
MGSSAAHHQHFDPTPDSTRAVRHAVADRLPAWGLDELADDAVLCASELASNAVLHARDGFELVMRPIHGGVRVEIIDRRPDLVPMAVPTVGTATSVTSQGTTGRGLQIVSALASRWGFNTSSAFKAVWFELIDEPVSQAASPVVELGFLPADDPDAREFHLLSLPVRAAAASGVQVDDLVRELQLWAPGSAQTDDLAKLDALLDASAPARLLGRHAALDAAARGLERFDLRVALSATTLAAFGALNELLGEMSDQLGPRVPLPAVVIEFRGWLVEEIAGQAGGREPAPCPLPS